MQREEARTVIRSALWLPEGPRLGGELDEKETRRERISDLMVRMGLGADNWPRAADLLVVLDDSDPEIKEALAAWSPEDAPPHPSMNGASPS
jgi:hypothetical protein